MSSNWDPDTINNSSYTERKVYPREIDLSKATLTWWTKKCLDHYRFDALVGLDSSHHNEDVLKHFVIGYFHRLGIQVKRCQIKQRTWWSMYGKVNGVLAWFGRKVLRLPEETCYPRWYTKVFPYKTCPWIDLNYPEEGVQEMSFQMLAPDKRAFEVDIWVDSGVSMNIEVPFPFGAQ